LPLYASKKVYDKSTFELFQTIAKVRINYPNHYKTILKWKLGYLQF
jgi:hypothetical protein